MVWVGWKSELIIKLFYMLQKEIWVFRSLFCHTLTHDSWRLMQLLYLSKIYLLVVCHKTWDVFPQAMEDQKKHVDALGYKCYQPPPVQTRIIGLSILLKVKRRIQLWLILRVFQSTDCRLQMICIPYNFSSVWRILVEKKPGGGLAMI